MTSPITPLGRFILMCAAFTAASVSLAAQTTTTTTTTTTDNPTGTVTPANTPADPAKDDVTHLSPFVVKADHDNGYSGQQTLIGSRTAKNLIDIPASITIINKELLDDLNVTNIAGAVRYGVSGVTPNSTFGDDFNIRGYRTETAMRNGVTKNANRSNPMYDVSRVEVIKGPAAMLLGNNSFLGGAINLISYEPSAVRTTDISTTFGNNSYFRLAANTAGPLFKSGDTSANYRLTVGGLIGDRDKEIENLKQKFIGAGFTVNFGSNSSLLVNAYYYRDESYLYIEDFLDITSTVDAQFNQYSTKAFSPAQAKNVKWKYEDSFLDVRYLARLSENGDLRFYYSGSSVREHRRHVRGISVAADNFTLNRQDIPIFTEKVNHNLQLDYNFRLVLPHVKVDSTIGADGATTYSRQSQSVNTPAPLDTRNPNWAADDAYFSVPQSGAGLPYQTDVANRPTLFSYYFQENIGFLDDRLILTGGLRWYNPAGTNLNYITNTVVDRNPTHFKVHKYGVVVKVLPSISAYYTDAQNVIVQTGFADLVVAGDQKGAPAGNQEGTLKEYGLKFDHKISEGVTMYGTLCHYDMSLTNIKTNGTLPSGNPGQIISGKDTSKGWELDYGLSATLGSGRADLIFTWTDGTSTTAASPGLQAVDFVPRRYSVLAKYRWSDGPLKNLMLGGGITDQAAKRNLTYRLDYPLIATVFASYEWHKNWLVQVNVDNVSDKRYIVALAAPGLVYGADGRQTRLEVKYKF